MGCGWTGRGNGNWGSVQDVAYEGVVGPLGIIPKARFLDLRAVL